MWSSSVWGHSVHLGSFGAFPIFLVHVVSQKRLIVECNGPKFGPRGLLFSVYRVLLTDKCSSSVWVIRCISYFRRPCTCISETANRRAKQTNLGLSCGKYLVYIEFFLRLCDQVQFGSFGAFPIFGDLVSRTRLVVEQNWPKFERLAVSDSVYKVHLTAKCSSLRSFSAVLIFGDLVSWKPEFIQFNRPKCQPQR